MTQTTGWVFPVRVLDIETEVMISVEGAGQVTRADTETWTDGNIKVTLRSEPIADGAAVLRIFLEAPLEFNLERVGIHCRVPAVEVHRQCLATSPLRNRASYASYIWHITESSSACNGVPFILCHSRSGTNTFFMGFAEQAADTRIEHHSTHAAGSEVGIRTTSFALSRPVAPAKLKRRHHRETVYLSRQRRTYTQVLHDYARFAENECGLSPAAVPEQCYAPVWCTWYAFQGGSVNHERVLSNAGIAASLGVGTILIDAGWFLPEPGTDPRNPLGNMTARPDRFPEMNRTIEEIRRLGMKCMLWTAPLFWRGTRGNPAFEHLRARFKFPSDQAYLCPQVEDSHIAASSMIHELMRRYQPDGLKIDFIDIGSPECVAEHAHAYGTVGESMDIFLRRIHEAIVTVRPDAMIEYRMNYANVNNKRYANMYRIDDAPYDFDQIRRGVAMIKPWAQPIPVHADYMYWDQREELATKAIAMASIMFGCVPTLSVDLVRATEEERALIKAWLGFYNERRHELVDGDYVPLAFDPHFSVARISAGKTQYFGLFSDLSPAHPPTGNDPPARLYLFNGSGRGTICTNILGIEGSFLAAVLDPFHRPVKEFELRCHESTLRIECNVPRGGLIRLNRTS